VACKLPDLPAIPGELKPMQRHEGPIADRRIDVHYAGLVGCMMAILPYLLPAAQQGCFDDVWAAFQHMFLKTWTLQGKAQAT